MRPRVNPLAQRSIMSRYVLKPIAFVDTDCSYQVGTGVTVATLLPMTNAPRPARASRLGPGPLAPSAPCPTAPSHARTGHRVRPWEAHLSGPAVRPLCDVGHRDRAFLHLRVGTPVGVTASARQRPDWRSRPLVRSLSGDVSTAIGFRIQCDSMGDRVELPTPGHPLQARVHLGP